MGKLREVKFVQYGMGPIGAEILKYALEKRGLKLVGAVDIDQNKVGRDVGEFTTGKKTGVSITDDAGDLLSRTRPDVVLHSTTSYLNGVKPQLLEIMKAGVDIISTCEELAYPFRKNPTIAEELDKKARRNKVTVLGTGVNPGFVMDTLALTSTGVCQEVESVRCTRVQDASTRRLPFQKKIGAGLTPAEFEAKVSEGSIKHVGFPESIAMIAAGLGWNLDGIEERIEPKLADTPVKSEYLKVEPGQVAGLNQTAWGTIAGEQVILLNLQAYLGCTDPRESIEIVGRPPINLTIKGGVHGDIATAAVIVNCIPRVLGAQPGLTSMKDLPVPSGWFGSIDRFIKKAR